MEWNNIREHALEARSAFDHNVDGRVDMMNGYYHLFAAWKGAESSEEKDELAWARILRMLAENTRDCFFFDDYVKYERFALPMLEAYKKAKEQGKPVSDEELRSAAMLADRLEFWQKTSNDIRESEEDSLILIRNMGSLGKGFSFHNSKTLLFTHDENKAEMVVSDGEFRVTIHFSGVRQVGMTPMDPRDCWIEHFRLIESEESGIITCEIGDYTILCSSLEVSNVEKLGTP